MRVVALISGGKDSCYNMMQCVSEGHTIVALANLQPKDKDELDSYMYQTVGHSAIGLYAEAMSLPLYRRTIQGSSKEIGRYYSATTDDEVEDLYELLKKVQSEITIEAVSVGAILSDYQRVRVENVCQRLGLTSLAYLWRRNQQELLKEMIDSCVDAIIIKVAALGLDPKKHLGMSIAEIYPHMLRMEREYGLNICGEGGEFETFTLDCPLFKKKLVIDKTETIVHSEDAFAPVAYLNLKKVHLQDKPTTYLSETERLRRLPLKAGCNLHAELFTEGDRDRIQEQPKYSQCEADNLPVEALKGDVGIQSSACSRWFHIGGLVAMTTPGDSVENVTIRIMDKLQDSIESLGQRMADLVFVCLYVRNMADYSQVNSVYKKYFTINPPVRVAVEAALPPNVDLLLDCGGCVRDDGGGGATRDTMHVQSISHWASANIGPYSQAVHVHHNIFVAGQIALCPSSMAVIDGGILAECRLSLRHVTRVLLAAHQGSHLCRVSHAVCYIVSQDFMSTARDEWERAVGLSRSELIIEEEHSRAPLLAFVIIPHLPRNALIEWHVHAFTGEAHIKDGRDSLTLANNTAISIDYCYCKPDDTHSFCSMSTIAFKTRDGTDFNNSLLELFKKHREILDDLHLPWDSLHMARLFFPSSLVSYSDMSAVASQVKKDLAVHTPVISLVPVTDLSQPDSILCICS